MNVDLPIRNLRAKDKHSISQQNLALARLAAIAVPGLGMKTGGYTSKSMFF
jgi:hypothetical protein